MRANYPRKSRAETLEGNNEVDKPCSGFCVDCWGFCMLKGKQAIKWVKGRKYIYMKV